MSTREDFEAHWLATRGKKKAGHELRRREDQPQVYVCDSANRHWVTYQAATTRQEAKIRTLRKSLNWALSNFEEPFEWSTEEDADAHREAMAAAKETT